MFIFRATAFANSVQASAMNRSIALARYGYAVFPLRSNKQPFSSASVAAALNVPEPPEGQGGAKLATRDPDAIVRLWTAFPDAMIGIATGTASSGLIVLDVDRKDGRDGLQTLAALGHSTPPTAWQQTRNSGYHYFYRAPAGQHCPTDSGVLGEALDRRGDGGYVIDYGFDLTAPIAPAPDWLLQGGPQRIHGKRHPLRDPQLAAPSFEAAVTALNGHDPNDLSRDKWIAATAHFRQAVSTLVNDEVARLTWDIWCNRYEKNDNNENDRQWNSIRSTSGGWTALRAGSPKRPDLIFEGRRYQLPQPVQMHVVPNTLDYIAGLDVEGLGTTSAAAMIKMRELNIPLAFDEFTNVVMLTASVPWDKNGIYPRQWTDNDVTGCKTLLESCYIKPSKETVNDVATFVAKRNRYHQVRDYLTALRWDRIERLPRLMPQYFGSVDNEYTRAIGVKFMIGAVARVMKPGCKMDNVVILEGAQGKLKSSSIAALAGSDWFTDELPDLHTKDAAIQTHGKWIIEVSELAALRKADIETIKKFMSRSTDRYRAPYERIATDHLRQCVFIATTNDDEYLKDQTGNRRFWPVKCGTISVEAIERDRDQLLAEAMARFQRGEQWWLTASEEMFAHDEQEERRETDPWEDRIIGIATTMGTMPITVEYIAIILGVQFSAQDTRTNKRIVQALKRGGFEQRQFSDGGRRVRKYVKIAR